MKDVRDPQESSSLAVFDNFNIRRHYDAKAEVWYFSVIDIVAALTETQRPRKYWSDLKARLLEEGSEVSAKIGQLKMTSPDGKLRLTDTADTETILRLVQSVPSKKAEPIKLWLARVGYERMQEIADPERALNRSRKYWQSQGRSKQWIQQRMMGQQTRNKLTDYWSQNSVEEGQEFAILTNIIHQEWSDLTVQSHKQLKGLKAQNLRDHMSEAELIFTALAELSTRQVAETMQTKGLAANKVPAKRGGKIARDARLALESKTSKSVVTGQNFLGSPQKSKKLKHLSTYDPNDEILELQ